MEQDPVIGKIPVKILFLDPAYPVIIGNDHRITLVQVGGQKTGEWMPVGKALCEPTSRISFHNFV
jgi:hypothetical protein